MPISVDCEAGRVVVGGLGLALEELQGVQGVAALEVEALEARDGACCGGAGGVEDEEGQEAGRCGDGCWGWDGCCRYYHGHGG